MRIQQQDFLTRSLKLLRAQCPLFLLTLCLQVAYSAEPGTPPGGKDVNIQQGSPAPEANGGKRVVDKTPSGGETLPGGEIHDAEAAFRKRVEALQRMQEEAKKQREKWAKEEAKNARYINITSHLCTHIREVLDYCYSGDNGSLLLKKDVSELHASVRTALFRDLGKRITSSKLKVGNALLTEDEQKISDFLFEKRRPLHGLTSPQDQGRVNSLNKK
ncbi:hypothetical protein BVX99_02585, partial [bacterium F16]